MSLCSTNSSQVVKPKSPDRRVSRTFSMGPTIAHGLPTPPSSQETEQAREGRVKSERMTKAKTGPNLSIQTMGLPLGGGLKRSDSCVSCATTEPQTPPPYSPTTLAKFHGLKVRDFAYEEKLKDGGYKPKNKQPHSPPITKVKSVKALEPEKIKVIKDSKYLTLQPKIFPNMFPSAQASSMKLSGPSLVRTSTSKFFTPPSPSRKRKSSPEPLPEADHGGSPKRARITRSRC